MDTNWKEMSFCRGRLLQHGPCALVFCHSKVIMPWDFIHSITDHNIVLELWPRHKIALVPWIVITIHNIVLIHGILIKI